MLGREEIGNHLVLTLALALTMQVLTVTILFDLRSVVSYDEGLPLTPTILLQSRRAISLMRAYLFVFQPLTLFLPLQILLDAKFVSLTGRPFPLLENVLHFTLLLANVFIVAQFKTRLLSPCHSDEEYFHLIRNTPFSIYQSYAYAALGATLWVKVLYLLRLNRVIGPLLKILGRMAHDIFNFLALLALILLTFSCVGMILFPLPEFSTLEDSLVTLFSWMLGDFSFETMQSEGLLGYLFLALYLLICMLVLLNLIIAILSSTYVQLETHGIGLYLRSVIDIHESWAFHPRFNLFTFRVPFFNLLSFLFSFCVPRLSLQSTRRLELFLYIPAFLLALLFFLSLDILSVPFAWLNTLRHHASRKRAGWFVLFLFFFPLYALALLCLDCVLISLKLWSTLPISTPMGYRLTVQVPLMKKDFNLV